MRRETSEDALRENSLMYEELLSNIPSGVYRLRIQASGVWSFDFVNSRFCELTGLNREEVLNNFETVFRIVHPDDLAGFISLNESVSKALIPFRWEGRAIINGETRWTLIESSPTQMDNGDVVWTGYLTEITNLKRAEENLKESEERFRLMFEKNEAIMLLVEPDSGAIVDANDAAAGYYGYRRETLGEMSITDINCLPPEEISIEIQRAKHEERNYFVFPHRLSNGETRTVEVYSSPIYLKGRTTLFSIVHDVTQRNLAEKLLSESRDQLALAIEGSGAGLWDWRVQTGETIFNERWAQILGYTLNELAPTDINTWLNLAHPEDLKKSDELLQRHFAGEIPNYEFESRMKHKDGHWVWVLDRGRVTQWDREGKPIRMTGTHLDITDQKRVEDNLANALDVIRTQKLDIEKALDLLGTELSDSERRFKTLFEAAQDFIFIKDRDLRYIDVNPAALELLGMASVDIIGKTDRELFGEAIAASRENIEERVLRGQTIESQENLTWKSQPVTVDFIRFPLTMATGEAGGVCGIAREVIGSSFTLPNPQPGEYLSHSIRSTFAGANLAAETNTTILLTGETGSGKDFFARYIHDVSQRSTGPYYSINCAAIPQELAESELFGHETGAFTSAVRRKRGLFELAEGGTLLLNEVGDLAFNMQSKLLTFLDTRSFTRVGGERVVSVNVRLIAATSKDLSVEVSEGRFRKDLFYRLNVFPILVPPLRDRLEDIPVMTDNILGALAIELQLNNIPRISPLAVNLLKRYNWPGNVRELKNVLERALILCRGAQIEIRHLMLGPEQGATESDSTGLASGKSFREILYSMERSLIEEALRRSEGKKQRAARLLGMSRPALGRHMVKLGISD